MTEPSRRVLARDRRYLVLLRAIARSTVVAWRDHTGGAGRVLHVRSASAAGKPAATFSEALVGELARSGLIADEQVRPRLTQAGRAWLRRQLASDDPFLEQHRDTHRRPLEPRRPGVDIVRINDAESPLAWLARRKDRNGAAMLNAQQFEAGERLRRDFTFAALSARVTADWSAVTSGGGQRGPAGASHIRDDVMVAKDRVYAALVAVGPELGRILFDVCCLLKGIETAEATHGLPQRSGKVVLQLALTSLARHYGLLTSRTAHRSQRRPLHWGTPDFRPVL